MAVPEEIWATGRSYRSFGTERGFAMRKLVGIGAAIATALGLMVIGSGSAAAFTCSSQGTANTDWTLMQNYTCDQVQARIDRYIQYYPTTYLGNWDSSFSFIGETAGTNAGNKGRVKKGGETSSWVSF